jgi:hypothetical protein
MATKWLEDDEPAQYETFAWRKDEKTGKVSRFEIRPIPPSWDRALRDRIFRGKSLDRLSTSERMEKGLQVVRARACYAMGQCFDFSVEAASPGAAKTLSSLLGEEIVSGQDVCLDGKLSAEVKEAMLRAIPELAEWAATKADDMREADAQAEDELGKT